MDELDRAILQILQTDGRISNADLARRVNLSPPAVHARVRRLEEDGLISAYVALLDWGKLGYDMLCFIHISLKQHTPETVADFRAAVQNLSLIHI